MSDFRKAPFFSKFLALSLLSRLFKARGKAMQFMEMVGKKQFKEAKKGAFKGYEFSERDVFAAVFSKSGTNWLMQAAQQIICRGEGDYEHIHQVVAWPGGPIDKIAPLHGFQAPSNAHREMRVIKSSSPVGELPYHPAAKYITIFRDPKDALVSGYHFMPGVMGLQGAITVDEFIEFFFSENYLGGNWAKHTAGWWAKREESNVLMFSFDDMKRDAAECIERICELLEIELTEEEMKKVCEKCSFAYMKGREDMFGPPIFPLANRKKVPSMVRSGKSNAGGSLLTREQQAMIDRRCLAELKALGSDFPYREFFRVVE